MITGAYAKLSSVLLEENNSKFTGDVDPSEVSRLHKSVLRQIHQGHAALVRPRVLAVACTATFAATRICDIAVHDRAWGVAAQHTVPYRSDKGMCSRVLWCRACCSAGHACHHDVDAQLRLHSGSVPVLRKCTLYSAVSCAPFATPDCGRHGLCRKLKSACACARSMHAYVVYISTCTISTS